jgi:hypothetical protein
LAVPGGFEVLPHVALRCPVAVICRLGGSSVCLVRGVRERERARERERERERERDDGSCDDQLPGVRCNGGRGAAASAQSRSEEE